MTHDPHDGDTRLDKLLNPVLYAQAPDNHVSRMCCGERTVAIGSTETVAGVLWACVTCGDVRLMVMDRIRAKATV